MQTARIVQAVVLMMIVAIAASCSASKEYTSKLFAPRTPLEKDSQAVALRFLELDSVGGDQKDWVTTDIIMGRDTGSKTIALDNLAKVFPASPVATINESVASDAKPVEEKTVLVDTKSAEIEKNAVAKNKKTTKAEKKAKKEAVKIETPAQPEPETVESEPVVRNLNPGEVRTKKTRD